MANVTNSFMRVSDPVLTNIIHGYRQANSIAPFVAPVVPVTTRSGKIVKFTRQNFAVINTIRTPGQEIKRVGVDLDNESYFLYQHAAAAEVPFEQYEEALNGQARLELRTIAANQAMQAIMQSWELEVVKTITDSTKYEASLNVVTSASDQLDSGTSDPEVFVQEIKELIRAQVGVYPSRMVCDPDTFNALKFHPTFRDRVKYTSSGSVTAEMMAQWFDLPGGIRVATRAYLEDDGTLATFMPRGTMVLLYNPEDGESKDLNNESFLPDENASISRPASFYTYQLKGYPLAGVERFDENTKTYVTDIIAEQMIIPVGLGITNKIGAAALVTNLLA